MATKDQVARFIDEYMIDLNGSAAALRAKITESKTYASTVAWNLLGRLDVREEIDRRIAERRASRALTVDRIEGMIRDIAETEVLDIYNADGTLRPFAEWPPHARRAVKSIEVEDSYIGGVQRIKVQFWDKKGAIELLGRYKKMFTDNIEIGGAVSVNFTLKGLPE